MVFNLATKKASSSGFTLIELLITISIIGIIFSVGMAKYTAFNRRQILDQSLARLKSDLREAQSMALAGKKGTDNSSQCSGDLRGVMLDFSTSISSYQIKSVCADNDFVMKDISLPTQITRVSDPETVLFKVMTGSAEFLTSATESTITLDGFGRQDSIVISSSGEVR